MLQALAKPIFLLLRIHFKTVDAGFKLSMALMLPSSDALSTTNISAMEDNSSNGLTVCRNMSPAL
ncbi:MAG: hypothetical protein BWY90_00411 [Deltaproteobacteria bacterium ADurb.BinA014]|nr:MAG: hypothetical protein BWY90_00411 [Deltaproteobacteria bacterium ADurb.BinA014]